MPRRNPMAEVGGPISDVRYVALKDGRRIQQITRDGRIWITPVCIDVGSLSDDERDEVVQALRPVNDPNDR